MSTTTSPSLELRPHPRLAMARSGRARLTKAPDTEFLRTADAWIADQADRWVAVPPLEYVENQHNSLLTRAREVQARVLTLLARFEQTGAERYRQAVLDHVRLMGSWRYWSWLARRSGSDSPTAIFDLSYGENAMTLAIAYDWLYDGLSAGEREELVQIAKHWPVASGLVHAKAGGAWWFGHQNSNWNTVCAGGLGSLCLAMAEEIPEAAELLAQVETSISPYFASLDTYRGGWPEGIGYWNYGMHYGFLYLLNWEAATGKRHPALAIKGVGETLDFPLDFCPDGQPCSFGDVNHWTPLPVHYAVARRLKRGRTVAALDALLHEEPERVQRGGWAPPVGWRLFHPTGTAPVATPARHLAKLYKGLDWGILADRMPHPNLYLSVRGGTTKVPHSHCDLLSFFCVVGGETMIANIGNREYLDTTFSERRYDLPELNAQYKNSLFVNGVGVAPGSSLERTERVSSNGIVGFRLVAGEALGGSREGGATPFCGRTVLMLADQAFLIVDRVELPFPGRIEARVHTYMPVQTGEDDALVTGQQAALRIAFAATEPCILATSMTAPSNLSAEPATMLRWGTRDLPLAVAFAQLIHPGKENHPLRIRESGRHIIVETEVNGKPFGVELSRSLRLL